MSTNILEVEGVSKDFSGVKTLDQVSFQVARGEVHALCGENGAGKSTLMNAISGLYPHGSYQGVVKFDGQETRFRSIADSRAAGLAFLQQELALIPQMSIAENIYLGHWTGNVGWSNPVELAYRAGAVLSQLGLDDDPLTPVTRLSAEKKQRVAMARALATRVRLLILDEPTASLTDEESLRLMRLLLRLKDEGVTSIFISHKLDEVLFVADTVSVLRDGRSEGSFPREQLTTDALVYLMAGRSLPNRFPPRQRAIGEVRLSVRHWTVRDAKHDNVVLKGVNFHVRRGEVVGFCGLAGSGRTELMMSLIGDGRWRVAGEVRIDGQKKNFRSPGDALRGGIAYVPEDRKKLGLVLSQDVRQNITNSNLARCSNWGIVSEQQVYQAGLSYWQAMHIKVPDLVMPVSRLSGGNQQKVVFGRCLYAQPRILILDEPTRGIDVMSRFDVYQIINKLAESGHCIVLISSEVSEVLGMSDRIYVMHEGRMKGELSAEEATQEKITGLMLPRRT